MLCRTVAGGLGDVVADNTAARRRCGAFQVLRVGADITDVGEGEGNNLARIRGVRENFLIPRDGGIEDHFTDIFAGSADCTSPKHRSII